MVQVPLTMKSYIIIWHKRGSYDVLNVSLALTITVDPGELDVSETESVKFQSVSLAAF